MLSTDVHVQALRSAETSLCERTLINPNPNPNFRTKRISCPSIMQGLTWAALVQAMRY
jgi:hypothetical protein